jgi:hypothetical protein
MVYLHGYEFIIIVLIYIVYKFINRVYRENSEFEQKC